MASAIDVNSPLNMLLDPRPSRPLMSMRRRPMGSPGAAEPVSTLGHRSGDVARMGPPTARSHAPGPAWGDSGTTSSSIVSLGAKLLLEPLGLVGRDAVDAGFEEPAGDGGVVDGPDVEGQALRLD